MINRYGILDTHLIRFNLNRIKLSNIRSFDIIISIMNFSLIKYIIEDRITLTIMENF